MKANTAISQIEQIIKLAMESTDIQIKGIPRSIRLPDDLDESVNRAVIALECDRTEIVVRCIQKSLGAVINDMVTERSEKVAGLLLQGAIPAPLSKRPNSTEKQKTSEGLGAAALQRKAKPPVKH